MITESINRPDPFALSLPAFTITLARMPGTSHVAGDHGHDRLWQIGAYSVGAVTKPDYCEHYEQLEFAEIDWFGNFFDYTEEIRASACGPWQVGNLPHRITGLTMLQMLEHGISHNMQDVDRR